MELLIDVLRTIDLLVGESPERVAEFMGLGRTRTLSKGHVVCRTGQTPDAVFVPLDGEMATVGQDSGGRAICYAFFGTGDCSGVLAALDGLPQPREVRVIRGGNFFVVARAAFLLFLDRHPTVQTRAFAAIGRLFQDRLDERDRDVFLPVHARVARFLLGHACVRGSDGARILLRETQPEIAVRLGSVREVVAREMAHFAQEGLIRRTRHALFVADWSALQEKAGCTRDGTCSCDADSAALRTRRFFLPAFAGGADSVADAARVCCEHVTTLRECVASGCPLALAAQSPSASSRRPDVGQAPRESRALAFPQQSTPGPSACRGAPTSGDEVATTGRSEEQGTARAYDSRARNAGLVRKRDETPTRSPAEEHEIGRRVAMYRRRAEDIHSRFGPEERVPENASVFRVLAETIR